MSTKSHFHELLNDLVAMGDSPAYATRKVVLKEAEATIATLEKVAVSLSDQLKAKTERADKLEALLNQLLDNATVYYSAIEINVHNRKGFHVEEWEAEVCALLGRESESHA